MRIIFFLLLISCGLQAQVLQQTNGRRVDRIDVFTEGLRLPQVCWVTGVPNLLDYSNFNGKGAVVNDTCAGKIKWWNGTIWKVLADSGSFVANSDTAAMLANYFRSAGLGLTGSGHVVSLDTASTVVLSRQRAANTYALAGAVVPGGNQYSIQYKRNSAFAGNATFVYDSVNARVGIGTASPSVDLHIAGTTAARLAIQATSGKYLTLLVGTVGSTFGFDETGTFSIGRVTGISPSTATADFNIDAQGDVGIGNPSGSNQVKFDIISTTGTFRPPTLTTTQRRALGNPNLYTGAMLYNSTLATPEFSNGLVTGSFGQILAHELITTNKTITQSSATNNAVHLHTIDATSGNITVTLPGIFSGIQGNEFQFVRIDGSANTVTISRGGSATINNGLTTFTMAQYERAFVIAVRNNNTFSWQAGKLTNY